MICEELTSIGAQALQGVRAQRSERAVMKGPPQNSKSHAPEALGFKVWPILQHELKSAPKGVGLSACLVDFTCLDVGLVWGLTCGKF